MNNTMEYYRSNGQKSLLKHKSVFLKCIHIDDPLQVYNNLKTKKKKMMKNFRFRIIFGFATISDQKSINYVWMCMCVINFKNAPWSHKIRTVSPKMNIVIVRYIHFSLNSLIMTVD